MTLLIYFVLIFYHCTIGEKSTNSSNISTGRVCKQVIDGDGRKLDIYIMNPDSCKFQIYFKYIVTLLQFPCACLLRY